MKSIKRKQKEILKYNQKRSKNEIRNSLFQKIQEASKNCEYIPEAAIKKEKMPKKTNAVMIKKVKRRKELPFFDDIILENSISNEEMISSLEDENIFADQQNNLILESKLDTNLNKTNIFIKNNGFVFKRPADVQKIRENLSITYQEEEIISSIKHNKTIFINGTTGCGKSTQVPQMLLENGFDNILISQPRKISCLTTSDRINYETQSILTAYRFRFENNLTKKTKIEIVTDGILLKEIISDIKLTKYKIIIIDEAHECTINLEIIIPILARLIKIRNDLRLIFMSATPNKKIKKLFESAPEIEIKSSIFPVSVDYSDFQLNFPFLSNKIENFEMNRLENEIFEILKKIIDKDGNILVFLTSKKQIYSMIEKFKNYKKNSDRKKNCKFLPFHASLSSNEQLEIFKPGKKCIFATNYAETSLTISGIKYVIDSGLQKICVDDGIIRSYKIIPISKASAEQRKGRAGRLDEGICYRIYSSDFFERMRVHSDTVKSSIDYILLVLYFLKIKKQIFINKIDKKQIENSRKLFSRLNVLKNNKITKFGKKIVQSNFSPQIAILNEKYDSDEFKLTCAILDSNFEFPTEKLQIDFYSEIFSKIDFILENSDFFPKTKIFEFFQLCQLKSKKIIFTKEKKLKISKCLFLLFFDNLCMKINDNFYYKNELISLNTNQKNMNPDFFVFQYLVKRNEKLYAVNITRVEKDWLSDLDNFAIES